MLTAIRGSLVGLLSFFLGDPFFSLDMWVLKLVEWMQCGYNCSFLSKIKPADSEEKVPNKLADVDVIQFSKVRNFEAKKINSTLNISTLCTDN